MLYAWLMLFITCSVAGIFGATLCYIVAGKVAASRESNLSRWIRSKSPSLRDTLIFFATMTAAIMLLAAIITGGIVAFNGDQLVGDTEILSGRVVEKTQERVSCTHSYSCNCRTVTYGSGKDQYTTTECDTCYEHDHDYDWMVATTVGDIEIDRVDRQGVDTPPRWAAVVLDEPVAVEHKYNNWIKGSKASVFNREGERLAKTYSVPGYPQVFDYYRIRRIVSDNPAAFGDKLNRAETDLANALRHLGPDKQVSVSIFHTSRYDQGYARAVYNAFSGGKKNDVMIVIGSSPTGKVDWVTVTSYSTNDMLNVKIRDDLLEIGDLKKIDEMVPKIVDDITKHFDRRRMRTFEYLSSDIEYVSATETVILCFIMAAAGVGIVLIMRNDRRFFSRF